MPDKVITSSTPCDCCGDAGFFIVPLSGFGDSRTFAVAGEACAFIADCITYIFENNTAVSSILGENNCTADPPFGTFCDLTAAVFIDGSVIDITGGITGKLACAIELDADGSISIGANMGSADAALKSGTLYLYDESYTLILSQAKSGTDTNEGFSFGGSAFENPVALTAGKYLLLLEYSLAADAGNENQFVAAIFTDNGGGATMTAVPPTIDVGGTLSDCASTCP